MLGFLAAESPGCGPARAMAYPMSLAVAYRRRPAVALELRATVRRVFDPTRASDTLWRR